MQIILSDYNCEGQAEAIFTLLERKGYTTLLSIELHSFEDVGLPPSADDETVWRFCQERGYLLLTGNRSGRHGAVSLEQVLRRSVTLESLPVLTIGTLRRVLADMDYCNRCAERLAEIVLDLDRFHGVPRLFLPG